MDEINIQNRLKMNNKYEPILKLQRIANEKEKGFPYKYKVYESIVNKSEPEVEIIRGIFTIAHLANALVDMKRVYYKKEHFHTGFNWKMVLNKPDIESYHDGSARNKIDNGYHNCINKPDLTKYVLVDNLSSDLLITFKDEYSSIPKIISEFQIFKTVKKQVAMSNGNKNIIAALILAVAIIGASVIIAYSNAYSNRYKLIDNGFAIVDTWTKKITTVHQ